MIVVDRKINDYRNRRTWEINNDLSVFCCDKLKSLREGFTIDETNEFPTPYLKIKSGDDYYSGEYTNEEEISFCPFCGKEIEVSIGIDQQFRVFVCSKCNNNVREDNLEEHKRLHFRHDVSQLGIRDPDFKLVNPQN